MLLAKSATETKDARNLAEDVVRGAIFLTRRGRSYAFRLNASITVGPKRPESQVHDQSNLAETVSKGPEPTWTLCGTAYPPARMSACTTASASTSRGHPTRHFAA